MHCTLFTHSPLTPYVKILCARGWMGVRRNLSFNKKGSRGRNEIFFYQVQGFAFVLTDSKEVKRSSEYVRRGTVSMLLG